MSEARQQILKNVARALTRTRPDPAEIGAQADALVQSPQQYRPDVDSDIISHFVAKATSERVTATTVTVDNMAQLPDAVRRYLAANSLSRQLVIQPTTTLLDLDWNGFDVTSLAELNQDVVLSLAEMGIAETGSVVFRSAPDSPTLNNFLALHHLVALPAEQIVSHLEDVWDHPTIAQHEMPRSINIVTGTSGTADIEGRNIRGAHGPRYMCIFLIGTPNGR